ncbi:hypothetical protein EV586_105299 [Tumebacillus sp. BK434]|nr:hypothetical protein EV586_105299 [Tumebacillus sp. BK434]
MKKQQQAFILQFIQGLIDEAALRHALKQHQ